MTLAENDYAELEYLNGSPDYSRFGCDPRRKSGAGLRVDRDLDADEKGAVAAPASRRAGARVDPGLHHRRRARPAELQAPGDRGGIAASKTSGRHSIAYYALVVVSIFTAAHLMFRIGAALKDDHPVRATIVLESQPDLSEPPIWRGVR